MSVRDTGSDIRGVIELLWSRKWLVLVTALLGGLIAALLASQKAPSYDSEAKVLVKPVVLSSTDPTQTINANMDTEAELADSETVADIVNAALKLNEPPRALLEDLDVSVAVDTEILSFAYHAPDPAVAQARTQAFAESYLKYRRQQLSNEILTRRKALVSQGVALRQQLERVSTEIRATDVATQRRILTLQAESLVQLITLNEAAVASFPENPAVGTIVQPASRSSSPSGPSDVLYVAIGVLLGAAIGSIITLLLERIADRPRSATELEDRLAAPVLALVPKRRRRYRDRKKSTLALWDDPDSPTTEAFRVLRTNLLASPTMKRAHTLLVTSAQPGEGKTTVAANLGIALALAGHRVLVVCAALRHPSLNRVFRCENSLGLTDVLTKGVAPSEAVRQSDLENFQLMTSGASVERPVELLGSETMRTLLRQLADSTDIVLIDGGSILGMADGLTIAPFADGVLFVLDADVSDGRQVVQARRMLDLINTPIVGGVLNRYSPSEERRSTAQASYVSKQEVAGVDEPNPQPRSPLPAADPQAP